MTSSSLVRRRPGQRALFGALLGVLSLAALSCGGGSSRRSSSSTSSTSGAAVPAPSRFFAITNVRVFDGRQTISEATVVVDGERIASVQTGGTVPRGALVIDGQGKTLLPGFIDSHVHVFQAADLEQSLAFGVTTVLDMFTPAPVMTQLRAEDHPSRADMRSAGYLATAPGGHGAHTQFGSAVPTVGRPDEAAAWVKTRVDEGSDYIKIVLDDYRAYGAKRPTLDVATFDALVTAAHGHRKLALVHASDYETANLAIEHGADGLVHLFRDRVPPSSFGAAVAGRKAFVIPTLVAAQTAYGQLTKLGADPSLSPWLPASAKQQLVATYPFPPAKGPAEAAPRAIQLLRDAGADLLAGTDAPNPGTTYGASLHEELSLLVAAGLSPSQALVAATSTPAARFGLTDRGRILPGLRADLVLVAGDPTRDINATRWIAGIWRGGQPFDREAYKRRFSDADRQATAAATTAPPAAGGVPATSGAPTTATTSPTAPTAPATPSVGLVSDFEAMPTAVQSGQPWAVATDEMMGGSSTAQLALTGGAHGSNGALEISGTLVKKGQSSWSGAMWMPGAQGFEPVDFSKKLGFTFQARGDGKAYVVMLFTRKGGMRPAMTAFTPSKVFATVSFTWSQFGSDGSDVTSILIGQNVVPGAFKLVIDDFELK